MHIALFLKVTCSIQISLKKIHILYRLSWKVTFSITEVNFLISVLLKQKGLRTKIEISLSVIGVKFPGEKKKKFVLNKIL